MRDYSLYDNACPQDKNFPIKVLFMHNTQCGSMFESHWHEQIEILYFLKGTADIQCESKLINVQQKDLIVINSNELHSGHNHENSVEYYCIIIDTSLLKSGFVDTCEMKYITPIVQNLIRFKNKISDNTAAIQIIKDIIDEYENKEAGYELSIKSFIYRLLVLMIRNHTDKVLTLREQNIRVRNLERLNKVLNHIENNYTETLDSKYFSDLIGVSLFHFYHLFKSITGKNISEYINHIRISKAKSLLKNTNMNISEIAMAVGFNDINYFSRLFKKTEKVSPSLARKMFFES